MELHQYFLNLSTFEFATLELLKHSNSSEKSLRNVLDDLIENYLELTTRNCSLKNLQGFRSLLCYKYSSLANSRKTVEKSEFVSKRILKLMRQFFTPIDQDIECDIICLQLVIYIKPNDCISILNDLQKEYFEKCLEDDALVSWYMKVLKCFLQYCILTEQLMKIQTATWSNEEFENVKCNVTSAVLSNMESWLLKVKDTNKPHWNIFYIVLPELLRLNNNTNIFSSLWKKVLKLDDRSIQLTVISILSDFIFPCGQPDVFVDYSFCIDIELWDLIYESLSFSDSQDRKKALFLFKRVIEFVDVNEEKIKLLLQSPLMNPFICKDVNSNLLVKKARDYFILIFEALEESQKHLIIPVLPLVGIVVQEHCSHKLCGNCFDRRWIYCIFSRLLEHDNSFIVTWGLQKSLELNSEFYNDKFIILILRALNNSFIFEKIVEDGKPQIVSHLTNYFCSMSKNITQQFLALLSDVSWGPVPIMYITHAMLDAVKKLCYSDTLSQKQLNAIHILVERNIKLHPVAFRLATQCGLIKILSYLYNFKNLEEAFKILTIFYDENLVNEPSFWEASKILMSKINYDNAASFISTKCKLILDNQTNSENFISVFAFIIQVLHELKIIFHQDSCIISKEFFNLFIQLEKADIRPYINVHLVLKIIELTFNIFSYKRDSHILFWNVLRNYKEVIYNFMSRLFNYNISHEEIKICYKILKGIDIKLNNKIVNFSIFSEGNDRNNFELKCVQVLNNCDKYNNVQNLLALKSWLYVSSSNHRSNVLNNKIFNLIKVCEKKSENLDSGKIAIDFYCCLAEHIENHLQSISLEELNKEVNWLEILASILDKSSNKSILYFGTAIIKYSILAKNGTIDMTSFQDSVRGYWNYNFNSKRDKNFWYVSQKLVQCMTSSEILSCDFHQGFCQEFVNKIMKEGESMASLKYILLSYSNNMHLYFKFFMEVILNGLCHGSVMRRDQRIFMDGLNYVKNSYYDSLNVTRHSSDVYSILNRHSNIDAGIRAAAVKQLYKCIQFREDNANLFLPLVLEKLTKVQQKRYFLDSTIHRLKHRIMQILLILQPHVNKESTIILHNTLTNMLITETDQQSVQLFAEWILMKIYLDNKEMQENLWDFFSEVYDKRPNCISSAINIIWHVVHQKKNEVQIEFVNKALNYIGACCMGQHFNMRLYGHVAFVKLYKLLDTRDDLRSNYKNFYDASMKSLQYGNVQKNSNKLEDDFYLNVFDPIKNYTLETIYIDLPRLCMVSKEEWVSTEDFRDEIFSKGTIKIFNSNHSLKKINIEKNKKEDISAHQDPIYAEISGDVQKKIIPWKSMFSYEEELLELFKNSINREKMNNIIVVASLVEKSQNLGGIARTCEIFGIKTLVISNIKQINDKEFKALSVSADKWLNIIEVKPFMLMNYLQEMKQSKWDLIGAEQTANSTSLLDYTFPKQVILVLGNEKDGIPPNIIPLLNKCIEIPQFGVTRSLNVHVSTAICLWEFIKQNSKMKKK